MFLKYKIKIKKLEVVLIVTIFGGPKIDMYMNKMLVISIASFDLIQISAGLQEVELDDETPYHDSFACI